MIAEVVFVFLMLGASISLQDANVERRDGTKDFAGAVQLALRRSQYGESTGSCARNCGRENFNGNLCNSICHYAQFNFNQMAQLTERCLAGPLCNIDLRNVQLTNVSIPFYNENFNGRCFLAGGSAYLSFVNFTDTITPVSDILPQAVYVDDITMYIDWRGFNVTCIPCIPGVSGTGFQLFDTASCIANIFTNWLGINFFNCPSKTPGAFTGRVQVSQKFTPRYVYVFSKAKTPDNKVFTRQVTVKGGYTVPEVSVYNFDSSIPATNYTDITVGIRNALANENLLQTLSNFFFDVYNNLYSFHVAAKCPGCP